jgi:hypothetical protein
MSTSTLWSARTTTTHILYAGDTCAWASNRDVAKTVIALCRTRGWVAIESDDGTEAMLFSYSHHWGYVQQAIVYAVPNRID